MALKFNPFTGTLDQTGSGGGGASYIDGEVQNFSALPETIGTPAVDSAYLVREPEGTWLLGRKPAGIYIRTANTGTRADDWTYAGAFPDVFNDANFLLYDNADSTKNLQFQLSGLTTGTTRTLTVPDASGTIALTSDITGGGTKTYAVFTAEREAAEITPVPAAGFRAKNFKRLHIRLQGLHSLGAVKPRRIEHPAPGLQRPRAERRRNLVRHRNRLDRRRGEIHLEPPVRHPAHTEPAGFLRLEMNDPPVISARVKQHMRRGQRRMPAQRHLQRRGKPTQRPHTICLRNKIGRLGDIVLRRDLQQHIIGKESVHRHDARLVALERLIGERIDLIEWKGGHGKTLLKGNASLAWPCHCVKS